MTPELSDIRRTCLGRPFILVAASTSQARYFKRVARFVSSVVVAAAQAAYRVSMAQLRALDEFVGRGRHKQLLAYIYAGDQPMVSRERAARLAVQFHGPRRELRGEA